MALQNETSGENRRELLKKVGTFAVPAVATFTLSEMKVHASGLGGGDVDQAWDSFWTPEKTSWLGGTKDWWNSNRTAWYNVWSSLK